VTRGRTAIATLCAALALGWLGAERDRAADGNRLYGAERYEEAETAYGEGLVDYPESARLRFNLGAAQYKKGNFADAITTLEKLAPDGTATLAPGDPASELAAKAAYNVGNARFRLGQQLEEQDPTQALALYEQALRAYKRSMGLDSADDAPKFNHEFVARHAAELKERIEKEQEQQEQQQEQEQQEGGENDEQGGEQESGETGEQEQQQQASAGDPGEGEEDRGEDQAAAPEPGGEEDGEAEEQERAQGGDSPPEPTPPENGQAQAAAGGDTRRSEEELTPNEARALIDTARGEEMAPAQLQRQRGVAGLGEPTEDW
jgi:Ca-activated chloride channel family protein